MWVTGMMQTVDVVEISLAETLNSTTVELVNGLPNMTVGAGCWVQRIPGVSTWRTLTCMGTPHFPNLNHSYSKVYHRAYNTNFGGGVFGPTP